MKKSLKTLNAARLRIEHAMRRDKHANDHALVRDLQELYDQLGEFLEVFEDHKGDRVHDMSCNRFAMAAAKLMHEV